MSKVVIEIVDIESQEHATETTVTFHPELPDVETWDELLPSQMLGLYITQHLADMDNAKLIPADAIH
jgi:hypothetical protein